MGNEQSAENIQRQREAEPKLSKAEVDRLLEQQRRLYEQRCQELVSQVHASPQAQLPQQEEAATATATSERKRTPYSYVSDELQNTRVVATPTNPNLYPNLNTNSPGTSSTSPTVHTFDFTNYVTKPTNSAQDFEFVNQNGQIERPRPSAPPRPSVPPRPFMQQQFSTPPPNYPPPQCSASRQNASSAQNAARAPCRQQRPRNRSASQHRGQSNNEEVNCPTCHSMFSLQIYQCSSGHSSCKSCKDYGRVCGICRNDITTMRNITLESYMAERKIPCPNKSDGCQLFIKLADMEFHIKECPFNELLCPILGCDWKGKMKQLSSHFDVSHPLNRSAEVDSEIRLENINYGSQNLYLVLIGNYNFLFHVKVSEIDRKIYMTAQLIGTKTSASKWSYEIHVYNKNQPRRKYTYTDVCVSHQEPVTDIFNDNRCSVLPHAYASTFVNNGAFCFKFFIKKTIDDKPRGNFENQRGKGRH